MTSFVFQRFAGSRQLRIQTFEDLAMIGTLPQALWLVTACPTEGLHCDGRFLQHLDSDRNGRIRAQELIEAIAWVRDMLSDPRNVVPGSDVLELTHLSARAAPLREAADLVLDNLESDDRSRITLEQVRRTTEVFRKVTANGDGIVSPESMGDPDLLSVGQEVLRFFPGATDKSGERGIDLDTLAAFEAARAKAIAWLDRGRALRLWGGETRRLALLVREASPKIDEYFLACRLVASQPETADRLRLKPDDVSASIGSREALARALAQLPIAPPDPAGRLSFHRLYRGGSYELVLRVRDEVLTPLSDGAMPEVLSEERWSALKAEAAPVLEWHDSESAHALLQLGEERIRAIEPDHIARVRALCENDLKLGETLAHLDELEKLILYQRWIFTFANNFVSMPYLYERQERALFEQGTLVLGGREFTLAVRVPDRAQHAKLAQDAGMFMMYLEVFGRSPSERFEIAVPVTSGGSDNLWVGKCGVFRTIDGEWYDARIVHVIVQPVSVLDALFAPFTKVGKLISRRLERMSQGVDKDLEKLDPWENPGVSRAEGSTSAATPLSGAALPPSHAPSATPSGGMGAGASTILMSGGVAFAAIASAIAFVVSQIERVLSENPLGLLYSISILVAIAVLPTVTLAWLKLRRRNLGSVLEGAGWALNDKLRLTRRLGKLFTQRPKLPKGSRTELRDQVRRGVR